MTHIFIVFANIISNNNIVLTKFIALISRDRDLEARWHCKKINNFKLTQVLIKQNYTLTHLWPKTIFNMIRKTIFPIGLKSWILVQTYFGKVSISKTFEITWKITLLSVVRVRIAVKWQNMLKFYLLNVFQMKYFLH